MFGYDNIGGKIKGCAQFVFVIEAIAAAIGGVAIMTYGGNMVLIGLLVIVFGPIVAWVFSWLLYGYGQLIENTDIIAEEYNTKNDKRGKATAKRKAEQESHRRVKAKAAVANSNIADSEFIDITCPNCKEELSYTKEQLQCGDETIPKFV